MSSSSSQLSLQCLTPSCPKWTYLFDDCMAPTPLPSPSFALPGIVAAKEAHGQRYLGLLGSSPERQCWGTEEIAACLVLPHYSVVQGQDAMHASTGTQAGMARRTPYCTSPAHVQSLRLNPTPVQQEDHTQAFPRSPSFRLGGRVSGWLRCEVVSPLPLSSASLLDEEHMSTQ
ncbi:hypothetical protein DHEL01_v201726 [Diaporthe helianthi]|uniref:Uncharacterized protein n=1 Tax=Diaporthe helianthi TaxID=158607 RepID=A0A2P5IBL8_DIAHE|nr:hypothetical protein DHEL01_v201726 [Diaporthe helianthi]